CCCCPTTYGSPVGAAAPSALHALSLHDALPISPRARHSRRRRRREHARTAARRASAPCASPRCSAPASRRNRARVRSTPRTGTRSEEHTSELQSREKLVCRLLLEKKKRRTKPPL